MTTRKSRLRDLLERNREADRHLAQLIGQHIDRQSEFLRELQDEVKQIEGACGPLYPHTPMTPEEIKADLREQKRSIQSALKRWKNPMRSGYDWRGRLQEIDRQLLSDTPSLD